MNILTYSTSLIPFIENNDATRVQMASNQLSQALPLANPEIPYVQTGNEQLFTLMRHSIISKEEGTILESTLYSLVVHYFKSDIIKVYDINWRYYILYKPGETFPANAVIATDITVDNSNLVLGKNLLTVVMPFYGYNYEDAIIINEKLMNEVTGLHSLHSEEITLFVKQNEVLLSLSDDVYQPLPKIKETWDKGRPYAIKKSLDLSDLESLFVDPNKKYSDYPCMFYDIKIFPNQWNKIDRNWDLFIQDYLETIDKKKKEFIKKYSGSISDIDLDMYIYRNGLDVSNYVDIKKGVGKFYHKGENYNGVLIKLFLIYTNSIKICDKLANRHGNKGVISIIMPDSKMPKLSDGRTADIIINPLGMISRMNIGQLYELHCGEAVFQFRKKLRKLFDEKNLTQIREDILKFVEIIDNTKNKWYSKQTLQQLDDIDVLPLEEKFDEYEDIVNNFYMIQPPFEASKYNQLKKLFEWIGCKQTDNIYDPISERYIKDVINPDQGITFGYIYWLKLLHIAESKFSARSVGNYSAKVLQPVGGRKNKGGQRFGEMETWCFIAYDAMKNLDEMLTLKSDAINKKYKYIESTVNQLLVDKNELINQDDSESYRLLKLYLNQIGLDLVEED